MPAILTDPAIPAEELRQRLYSGDLVILTRLRALEEFVGYMRDELTELFAPYDPEHAHEHIEPAGDGEDPRRVEAPLDPRRAVPRAGPRDHRRGRASSPSTRTTTCRSREPPSRRAT